MPSAPAPAARPSDKFAPERGLDVTAHSWDLATGGLKTLTAKREFPPLLDRRSPEKALNNLATPRSYTFPLVILACVLVMLISGGIVLLMILQP